MKLLKFFALGLICFTSLAQAHSEDVAVSYKTDSYKSLDNNNNNTNTHSELIKTTLKLKSEIEQTLQLHLSNGYLQYQPVVSVALIPSLKTSLLNANNTGVNTANNDHANMESFASLQNEQCKVQIILDDEGNVPYLVRNELFEKISSLKNDQQKKMAREFLALHESFHCEFRTIDNPVITDKGDSFNKDISYLLKESITSPMLNKISYMDLLNENFADVAASLALVSQYGKDNTDLAYVLQAVQVIRHSEYFMTNIDTHFSHFSMKETLSNQTIEKFLADSKLVDHNKEDKVAKQALQKQNNNVIKQLSLEISNRGVGQLLTNKPELAQFVFANNPLINDVYLNAVQLIINRSITVEHIKNTVIINPWANIVKRGYSYELAEKITAAENPQSMKFYKPDGQTDVNYPQLHQYVFNLLKTKQPDLVNDRFYQKSSKQLEQFKQYVIKSKYVNDLDYITEPLKPQQVEDKIAMMKKMYNRDFAMPKGVK